MARTHGFTLVELLIVVVFIALFAATVVPALSERDEEAKIAAAQNVVRGVARQIERYRAQHDEWPPRVQAEWFRGHKLPINPLEPDHPRSIDEDNDAGGRTEKWHPTGKTTASWPFWYNPSNGSIRIRVPEQATREETLALYNLVNGTDAKSMGDIKK